MTHLAERAVRLPAGPSNLGCHAGVSFTALRDSGAFPPSPGARHAFSERLAELVEASGELDQNGDERTAQALRLLRGLAERTERGFRAANHRRPAASTR